MNVLTISPASGLRSFAIGRRGENAVSEVRFDYSAWIAEFGSGVCSLLVKRPTDATAYPVVLTCESGVAYWIISSTDTSYAGIGAAEFSYTVDEQIAKSVVFETRVLEDIGAATETPPDPFESWVDTLTDLGTETEQNALDAQSAADSAAASKRYIDSVLDGLTFVSIEDDILTFTVRSVDE